MDITMAPQIITSDTWKEPPKWVRGNLFETIRSNPNKVADSHPAFIRLDGKVYTRGELFRDAKRLAHALVHKLHLKQGDRVGLLSPNTTFYPAVMYACMISGIVAVPMNAAYGADEIVHPAEDSDFQYLFAHPSTLGVGREGMKMAKRSGKNTQGLQRLWVMTDDDGMQKGEDGEQDLRTLLGKEEMEPIAIPDPENTLVFLGYSSGTTGKSKGAEMTHYNMTSNCILLQQVMKELITPRHRQLGSLPFNHIFAMSKMIIHAATVGCPVVVMQRFQLEQWLDAVQRFKITNSFVVPPMLVLLAKNPVVDKYNLSSLEWVMSGAAPLSAELGDEVEQRIPTLKVTQGYGLTETSPTVSFTDPQYYKHAKGSAGRLVPGVEMRLVDDEGKDVGHEQGKDGKPGELWFRGPIIFKRYLNNPAATEDCKTADGWFKTGDVGIYVEREGYRQIFIVDRKKELIKYKGFQVAPAELESLLLTHPSVADAACTSVYDKEQATELPRGYVVPREGVLDAQSQAAREQFAREIVQWVGQRVANHKKLRGGVVVLEEIPKSPSGKILRRILRDQAQAEGLQPKAKL